MQPYEMLRPLARLAFRSAQERLAVLPVPRDAPTYRSGDPLADRFLIVGNGRCSGWGVMTHQLALTGALGRSLRSASGGPVDVDLIGGNLMRVESAVDWLGDRAGKGYRGVLVMLGIGDAVRLTPIERWRRHVGQLLDRLDADLEAGAPVFFSILPPLEQASNALGVPGRHLYDRHARRLNAVSTALAARHDRVLLFEDGEGSYERLDVAHAADQYQRLGSRLAAIIQPVLDRAPAQPLTSLRAPSTWAAKHAAFGESGADGGPLQNLVEEAATDFGVSGASVTVLDGEHVWVAASSVQVPPWLPRDLCFCETTTSRGDTVVVPDTTKDLRFRDNPLVREFGSRFYAGHPLRDVTGTVIGAVCIVDSRPKTMSEVDLTRLRTLAKRTELHLHELERRQRSFS